MKRFLLSLLVLVILAPTGIGIARCFAQEITLPMPLTKRQKLLTSAIIGPAMNSFFEKHRPGMLGLSFAMNPMFKAGLEKEYGFTEDQSGLIMEKLQQKFGVGPPSEMEAFGNLMKQLDERAAENEDAEYLELSEEEIAAITNGYSVVLDKFAEIAPEVFTPEQMAKVNELEFATFGGIESPFLSVESMGPLDLTDEQKKEIEEFQNEIADEKKAMFKDITEFTTKVLRSGKLNMQEAQDFDSRNKTLTNKIGTRLREILTDEQLEKATKIVKDQQAKLAKMMGGLGAMTKWVPGADSWAPGMPIPDSLKSQEKEKKPAFPRARKKE